MSLFKEIIAENIPNLSIDLDIQVHRANRSPYCYNAKRPFLRDTIIKVSKKSRMKKNTKKKKPEEKSDCNLQRNTH